MWTFLITVLFINVALCCDENLEPLDDFISFLFSKNKSFPVQPDQLPCLSVDPLKSKVLAIGNEGVRVCDICPSFPQKRISNVYIDSLPVKQESGKEFEECFEICFNSSSCVAFSYDHEKYNCYINNSTEGGYMPVTSNSSVPQWTTVIMTQPTGIINNWSYVRHTAISGEPHKVTTELDFLSCVLKCETNQPCEFVSYSYHNNICEMFNSTSNSTSVNLKYGFASAFNIRRVPYKKGDAWRFSDLNIMLQAGNQSEGRSILQTKLRKQMDDCLSDTSCYGIGYDNSTQVYVRISMDKFLTISYNATSILLYPKLNSGLHEFLDQFEFVPNIEMTSLDVQSNLMVNSLEECIAKLNTNREYTKASYSYNLNICHLGDAKVSFQENKKDKFVTILPKPGLMTSLKNFVKVPGLGMNSSSTQVHTCYSHCEEECTSMCKQNCSHMLITYLTDRTQCNFYSQNDTIIITTSPNTYTFIKHSAFNFSLQSFDKLSSFQQQHLYSCFSQGNNQSTNMTILSKRFGLSSVWSAVNSIGKSVAKTVYDSTVSVAETVYDAAETVYDTAETIYDSVTDLSKSVKKVAHDAQVEWEGSKHYLQDIPIIEDIATAIDLGFAVLNLDFETALTKFSDLLNSDSFNLISSLLPGGGIVKAGAILSVKFMLAIIKLSKRGSLNSEKFAFDFILQRLENLEVQKYKGNSVLEGIVEKINDTTPNLGRSELRPFGGFTKMLLYHGALKTRTSLDEKVYIFLETLDCENKTLSLSFDPIKYITTKYKKENTHFVLTPKRWDNTYLNENINKLNSHIENILSKHNVDYLDPNTFLCREHYARDGVNLNIKGKLLLNNKLQGNGTKYDIDNVKLIKIYI